MKFRLLSPIVLSLVTIGCTNVAGDKVHRIAPVAVVPSERASSVDSSDNPDTGLFASAAAFFNGAGYQCRSQSEGETLRCSKLLRDSWLHQTRAVVQIFRDGPPTGSYTLVSSRWDEGFIPSEFLPGEFRNADVPAFCQYLNEKGPDDPANSAVPSGSLTCDAVDETTGY